MHRSLIILLMCCSSALARDPFQPLPGAACVQPVEPLSGWRLQGIIGRNDRFHAWLLGPKGNTIKLQAGQPFPMLPWRLATITRRSVVLAVENSCSMQTFSFQIKGRARDKDDHFDAGIGVANARSSL